MTRPATIRSSPAAAKFTADHDPECLARLRNQSRRLSGSANRACQYSISAPVVGSSRGRRGRGQRGGGGARVVRGPSLRSERHLCRRGDDGNGPYECVRARIPAHIDRQQRIRLFRSIGDLGESATGRRRPADQCRGNRDDPSAISKQSVNSYIRTENRLGRQRPFRRLSARRSGRRCAPIQAVPSLSRLTGRRWGPPPWMTTRIVSSRAPRVRISH